MEASQSRGGYTPPRLASTVTIISSGTGHDLEKQRQLEYWDKARTGASSPVWDSQSRAHPIIILVSIIFLFHASVAGIAFFVMALVGTVAARAAELPSRIVVLTASTIGVAYTLIHLAAARTSYRKKEHGSPQIYGNYKHAMGLLLVRLAVPVWITAVVTAALAVSNTEGGLTGAFQTDPIQMSSVNLLVAAVGLLANLITLLCVETSMTPFATFLVSKSEFLQHRGRSTSSLTIRGEDFEEKVQKPQQFAPVQPVHQSPEHHRALNSHDCVNGSWPVQRSQSTTSSVYSTQTYQSRTLGAQRGQPEPLRRPGTAISTDTPVEAPHVRNLVAADVINARAPVHMSWRPPSHHGKLSIDYTVPPLPTTAANQPMREPLIPSLPTAAHTQSSASRAPGPAAVHQSRVNGPREMPSSGAFPRTSARPAEAMTEKTATFNPEFEAAARAMATPSPRGRSLRSHPPFDSSSEGERGRSVARPSTAPGLPPSTIENWGVPYHGHYAKRRPVGQGRVSSDTDKRPATGYDGYSSSCYDDDDDSDYQDEDCAASQPDLSRGLSRTKRRLQKGKALQSSNTINHNFSRPLPRSKSLASMRRRSTSGHDQRASTSFFNGDFH